MNKWLVKMICIIFLINLYSCKGVTPDHSTEEPSAQNGPNIGGLDMPRGLINKTNEATPGYVYFSPLLSGTTYLVNMAGDVVHKWESEFGPSGWLYLKENGNLLRGGRDPKAPVFDGGGQGGRIREFTWDGELIWDFSYATEDHLTHHDVAIMPNGNILAISWEAKSVEESIIAGRKPELIPKAGLWPDKVVEFEPMDNNEAKIVWEWHIWDHLVQDYDESKDNYGNPSDHPELLDINIGSPLPSPTTKEELDIKRSKNNANTNDTPDNQGSDLYHMNAINYNPELDQIVLSSPSKHEIFIIDHSTSTEEAASHQGGRWGKGGDILYRWGNPQNYSRGDTSDQILQGQHDVTWIPKGYPGEGNLLVFNNIVANAKPGYSAVMEITPPLDENGYTIPEKDAFGPKGPTWQYTDKDTMSMFAPFISGVHRMENGNTFVTVGPKGRYIEVNPSGKVLWDYWTPYSGDVRMPDGTTPQPIGPFIFSTFRATHIPASHPAIKDKKLEPLNPQPPAYEPKK